MGCPASRVSVGSVKQLQRSAFAIFFLSRKKIEKNQNIITKNIKWWNKVKKNNDLCNRILNSGGFECFLTLCYF
jgi:hypothetical protein